MRIRSWIFLVVTFGLLAAGSIAAWSLRAPLQQLVSTVLKRPSTSAAVTFAVLGDNHGDNPVYRQILTELKSQRFSFLLNLADTSEYGTRQEFESVRTLESALPFPVYHTVGNHDIKTDPSRALFTSVFQQNPWRSYDFGQLHLVILDNADRKVGFPGASLNWLEQDLTQHKTQTIIVAYHRPFDLPLASLVGDDETPASRESNQRLTEIVQRYGVKYILTGHIHTYLQYSVGDIPAVVSGGGGDPAQTILGGPSHNYFHYLTVTVRGSTVSIAVHPIATTAL